jgi:S-adenosylmethionine-dependent methyltransferase
LGADEIKADADFDELGDAFEEEIYGSTKGYIRLHVLWEDLLGSIPALSKGGLSVLDAGGGAGRVAVRVAALGNRVVLADPSRAMLDRAEASVREADLGDAVTTVQASVQELSSRLDESFDVVMCHAVLEWLAQPREAVTALARLLNADGVLSLLFFNRNAAVLKSVLSGSYGEALADLGRQTAPAGPIRTARPLAESEVREWLTAAGLQVRSKAGIRIFHDHLRAGAGAPDRLDELLAVETALRAQEPFASLGQHLHLVCNRVR